MADPIKNTLPRSLSRMRDANYEVAPGEEDVRGWQVALGNDEVIGEVDELIIDPSEGKVRYLDVELDRDAVGGGRERVLVPIADAQLDTRQKEVVLSGLSHDALSKLPEYDQTTGNRYDDTFHSHLSNDFATKRVTRSAEEVHIGKRLEQPGEGAHRSSGPRGGE